MRDPVFPNPVVSPARLIELPSALGDVAQLWVACSGGLDSTVLLHALARLRERPPLRAIHVHHGLQAAADGWAEHCAQLCDRLDVPLQIERVQVSADDPAGPEAAARAARRAAYRRALGEGDWLALAHHRDDQAETLLLRLFRGSGIAGLAAMRAFEAFPPGRLWRPLLQQPRAVLRAYAETHGLSWIEDPHNADARYTRSWLRREVVPQLRARYPALDDTLARTAAQAAEARGLLEDLADADLAAAGARSRCLPLTPLLQLSGPRQRNALRRWLAGPQGLPPDAALLARVQQALIAAREDAQPQLAFGGEQLHRYRMALYRLPVLPPAPPAGLRLDWLETAPVLPEGCGSIEAAAAPPWPLQLGFAQGGEALRVAAGGRTRSLRNLWQEAAVPPWERARTPLLYRAGQLVAVGVRWCCPVFAQECADLAWRWHWQPAPGLRGD